jgi:hypothetical protein
VASHGFSIHARHSAKQIHRGHGAFFWEGGVRTPPKSSAGDFKKGWFGLYCQKGHNAAITREVGCYFEKKDQMRRKLIE